MGPCWLSFMRERWQNNTPGDEANTLHDLPRSCQNLEKSANWPQGDESVKWLDGNLLKKPVKPLVTATSWNQCRLTGTGSSMVGVHTEHDNLETFLQVLGFFSLEFGDRFPCFLFFISVSVSCSWTSVDRKFRVFAPCSSSQLWRDTMWVDCETWICRFVCSWFSW